MASNKRTTMREAEDAAAGYHGICPTLEHVDYLDGPRGVLPLGDRAFRQAGRAASTTSTTTRGARVGRRASPRRVRRGNWDTLAGRTILDGGLSPR